MDENKNPMETTQQPVDNSVKPENDGRAADLYGISLEGTKPGEGMLNPGWKESHKMQRIDDSGWKVKGQDEKKPYPTKAMAMEMLNGMDEFNDLDDEYKAGLAHFLQKGYPLEKLKEVGDKVDPGNWIDGIHKLKVLFDYNKNDNMSLAELYKATKMQASDVGDGEAVRKDNDSVVEGVPTSDYGTMSPADLSNIMRKHLDDYKELDTETRAEYVKTMRYIKKIIEQKGAQFTKNNVIKVLDYVQRNNKWPH